MLATVAHIVLELVLQVFLEFVCYALGNLCVSIFTLGRWSCEGLDASTSRPGRRRRYRLPKENGNRRRQVSVGVTQLVGFLAFAFVVGMVVALTCF